MEDVDMQPVVERFSEGDDSSLWQLCAQLTPEESSDRKRIDKLLPLDKTESFDEKMMAETLELLSEEEEMKVNPSLSNDETLELLKECTPLSLERAYGILVAIRKGNDFGLDVRSTASPLIMPSSGHSVYIVRKGLKQENNDEPQQTKISVSFQSVQNCEFMWFSETEGIASRPMSRTSPGRMKVKHGCQGRFYSLIKRAPGDENELPIKRRRGPKGTATQEFAQVVTFGDGLVHAWRLHSLSSQSLPVTEDTPSVGTNDPASVQTTVERIDNSSEDEDEPLLQQVPTTTFQGTVRIAGDLRVEGTVYGVLTSRPRCADYAEYFEWDTAEALNPPPKGSVVRLKSPEQKLTLNTNGDGPCLIVSTSPSVAAGVPSSKSSSRGALVAFLGQVPVRTRGLIKVGDQLVPSGRNDGTAVSLRTLLNEQHKSKVAAKFNGRNLLERWLKKGKNTQSEDELQRPDALGIAMEHTSGEKDAPKVILSFVRWNHAIRRELHEHLDKVAHSYQQRWMHAFVDVITSLAIVAAIFEATHTIARIAKAIDDNAYGQIGVLVFRAVAIVAFAASVLNFILIIAFFVLFSVNRVQGGKAILAFWCLFVGIFIGITQAYLAFRYIFNFTNILYCFLLIHLMSKIRGRYLPSPCDGWDHEDETNDTLEAQDDDDYENPPSTSQLHSQSPLATLSSTAADNE
mmetsp:Transcript_12383/g.16682  ORF Transcript_12383/g.16682 Transcript_12383/m.16682 type:complete len:687 (+) Transcript_12383:154-2214(+)|eukprot:CAMPEP_0197290118 /NCGR_PEP_ID=MMETSP0890-20130614/7359_1 /TAXON_ID=44058 ORGANISM="Aureoumbra lagunensis, Strain CCMP1510" /NCGR_SAMPLE_ID=MMETSP0890 /ASSEMBLY_ACC=CAM_ASM_000533 /LENGTH=686 /DNA_ID=CAMNT_0042761951 /DNA_START=144 /DNA_END=2204 /DNA_ORIENTATION=+